MGKLIVFIIGFIIGVVISSFLLSLVMINRVNDCEFNTCKQDDKISPSNKHNDYVLVDPEGDYKEIQKRILD